MIHPQVRREPVPQEGTGSESTAGPVPRQGHTGDHPDAFDLYAQIYALRSDLSGDVTG